MLIECCKGCPHYAHYAETRLEPEENSCAKDWECAKARCENWYADIDDLCDWCDWCNCECTGYDVDCAWYHSEVSNG